MQKNWGKTTTNFGLKKEGLSLKPNTWSMNFF